MSCLPSTTNRPPSAKRRRQTTLLLPPTTRPPTSEPTVPAECCYEAGCGGHGGNCIESNHCSPPEALHEVRCCSDDGLPAFVSPGPGYRDPDFYSYIQSTESKNHPELGCPFAYRWGSTPCPDPMTYREALDYCTSVDGRLCTKAEVKASCAAGTGCGFDVQLIWTSDGTGVASTTEPDQAACRQG